MGSTSDADLLVRAVRNPGRLVLGPTSVSSSFPHGGLSLGFVTECELDWEVRYYESYDPASGALAEITRRSVEVPRIVCLLEGPSWDVDALTAIFTKTTAAASLAHPTPAETRIQGTMVPAVVPAWSPLLFVADDPQGKSVYFRRPIPRLSLRQSVALARTKKAGLPLVFSPTPDANHTTTPYWQIARLENLTI